MAVSPVLEPCARWAEEICFSAAHHRCLLRPSEPQILCAVSADSISASVVGSSWMEAPQTGTVVASPPDVQPQPRGAVLRSRSARNSASFWSRCFIAFCAQSASVLLDLVSEAPRAPLPSRYGDPGQACPRVLREPECFLGRSSAPRWPPRELEPPQPRRYSAESLLLSQLLSTRLGQVQRLHRSA